MTAAFAFLQSSKAGDLRQSGVAGDDLQLLVQPLVELRSLVQDEFPDFRSI